MMFSSIEAFANRHYAPLRFALEVLQHDDKGLEALMAKIARDRLAPSLLEGWCEQKEDLKAQIAMIEAALTRSFEVLERLGYGPDNPPLGPEPDPKGPDGEPKPEDLDLAA